LSQAERISKVFEIPEYNMGAFETTLGKLQRRALKLGCGELGYKVLGEEIQVIKSVNDDSEFDERKHARKIIKVEVFGDAPQLAGWKFIAKINHDPRIGNIIAVLPGQDLPVMYRDSDLYNCDHCHKRLFRRDTFVVLSAETGEYKQVGRHCLRDFLGHQSPEAVARYFEYFEAMFSMSEDFEEHGFGGGHGTIYDSLLSMLTVAAAVIRTYGWASKKQERESDSVLSTSARVSSELYDRLRSKKAERLEILDDDRTSARAAMEWFRVQNDKDDFFYNARLLAEAEWAKPQHVGIASAMMWIYLRTQQKAKAGSKSYEYLGAPGQRLEIGEVELLSKYGPIDSQFGPSYVYRFSTGKSLLVWFTGKVLKAEIGDKLSILKATVREHKEYHSQKETVISRTTLAA